MPDAVEKERRRPTYPAPYAAEKIRVNPSGERAELESVPELTNVEAEQSSVAVQRRPAQIRLVLKEVVMHLPELALGARRLGGFRGDLRIGLDRGHGEVAKDDPHPTTHPLLSIPEDRVNPTTGRASVVAILDDGELGRVRTSEMVTRSDGTG